jgi:molybdopterin molybdotransferase
MIEVSEALEQMLHHSQPLPLKGVPLMEAVGCYAAREVLATVALPGFDNSAMDGYAVRTADASRGGKLQVVGQHAAGLNTQNLQPLGLGRACRIFTGAAVPPGADAVVMQEDVEREGEHILIHDDVDPGQFIRRKGSDICAGQILLRRGSRINAAAIGLLASQGRAQVDVFTLPRVGVLTTGDELIPPGATLQPGQIYNSNGPMLEALLRECGIRDVIRQHVADTQAATVLALMELTAQCNAVIISGGVSVGERDFVKPALAQLGLDPLFWRVRMKPGKPFLFARTTGAQHTCSVFGLPGNPVSSYTTFRVLVQPLLRRLMGDPQPLAHSQTAIVAETHSIQGDRPQYLHGEVKEGKFHPLGLQRSDALHGLSQGAALLRVEPGETVPAGTLRQVIVG